MNKTILSVKVLERTRGEDKTIEVEALRMRDDTTKDESLMKPLNDYLYHNYGITPKEIKAMNKVIRDAELKIEQIIGR